MVRIFSESERSIALPPDSLPSPRTVKGSRARSIEIASSNSSSAGKDLQIVVSPNADDGIPVSPLEVLSTRISSRTSNKDWRREASITSLKSPDELPSPPSPMVSYDSLSVRDIPNQSFRSQTKSPNRFLHSVTPDSSASDLSRRNRSASELSHVTSYECPVCFDLLYDPLTLRCGHTMCRICLLQAINAATNTLKCPTCRNNTPKSSMPEVNVLLKATLARKFPKETALREKEAIIIQEKLNKACRKKLFRCHRERLISSSEMSSWRSNLSVDEALSAPERASIMDSYREESRLSHISWLDGARDDDSEEDVEERSELRRQVTARDIHNQMNEAKMTCCKRTRYSLKQLFVVMMCSILLGFLLGYFI